MEQKQWENLNYEQNTISFEILKLCYKKVVENYNNLFTFFEILKVPPVSVDKGILKNNLLNCIKKYEHSLNAGIHSLKEFIFDYSNTVRNKDLLNNRMNAYINSFNSIINSKQAERYRIKYFFGETSDLYNYINNIIESYTKVRTYLVRYVYSSIYREDDFNKSILELKKILYEESNYLVTLCAYLNTKK